MTDGLLQATPPDTSGALQYLDESITYWRSVKAGTQRPSVMAMASSHIDAASAYIDAFQSVRTAFFGSTLP